MKIILFTSELSEKNGWGRYSLKLAGAFEKFGHEVKVICHQKNEAISGIEQKEFLPNPLSYRWNYFLFFVAAIKVFFSFRSSKDLVVHCLVETYAPTAWLFSLLFGRPLFLTVHGSFGVKPLMYFLPGLMQKFIYLRHKTNIICVSRYTSKRLSAKIGTDLNSTVIHNGVEPNGLDETKARAGFEHTLLGVGAVKKRKGFHLVVEALPKLRQSFSDLKYWIVGDLSDKVYLQGLREKINNLGLEQCIEFFENINDQKLRQLYEKSGLFILTPLSDEYNFEGFGLVYLEANSFGLPVVGMKDNGGEEAIQPGQTGLLAETGSVESVVQAVSKIWGDKQLYQKMSAEALNWAELHSWQRIAGDYLNLYTAENGRD